MLDKIKKFLEAAENIVVIQADNPDGDSLASALALEQILSEAGKNISLYCGVDIPVYLRHMPGWDRVSTDLPVDFDATIIVDTSAVSLLDQVKKNGGDSRLRAKPCLVLDHHTEGQPDIDYADITYVVEAVATGEIIYNLSNQLQLGRNHEANEFIMMSIMSDSLGLASESTTSASIRIVADLVDQGVSIPDLDNLRRSMQKKSPELLSYKGKLLERIEYNSSGEVATVHIPWPEIEKYSPQYNPSMLVIDEMRMVNNVKLAIAFKTYPDGRITAKIRTNRGYGVASQIAEKFGGGGHPYAAGFKMQKADPETVKKDCVDYAQQMIDTINKDGKDEAAQYAYTVD